MKKLYLMRHGKTYFNKIGKSQGWCDSPLTQEGIEDAMKAKKYFIDNNLNFDCAYSSTLGRARDTLEIIASSYIEKTEAIRDLRELSFGRFEGESIELLPPLPFNDYFVSFGGESEEEALSRINKSLTEIMNIKTNNTVLVVSHGSLIREFTNFWAKYSQIKPMLLTANGSIQIYNYDGEIFYLKEYIEL